VPDVWVTPPVTYGTVTSVCRNCRCPHLLVLKGVKAFIFIIFKKIEFLVKNITVMNREIAGLCDMVPQDKYYQLQKPKKELILSYTTSVKN